VVFPISAQVISDNSSEPDACESDLWYFQLKGNVKSAVIMSFKRIVVLFDRNGRITYMRNGDRPVTIHRDDCGRIDSITTSTGRLHDHTNTRYRLRATDDKGNWMARKTTREPYAITTEYCTIKYYDEVDDKDN